MAHRGPLRPLHPSPTLGCSLKVRWGCPPLAPEAAPGPSGMRLEAVVPMATTALALAGRSLAWDQENLS